jgi:RND family efflux transporter MFP subunit
MNDNDRTDHNFPALKGDPETSGRSPQPGPAGLAPSSLRPEFEMRSHTDLRTKIQHCIGFCGQLYRQSIVLLNADSSLQRKNMPMQNMQAQNATFTQNSPDPGSFLGFSQRLKKDHRWFIGSLLVGSLLVVLILLGGAIFAMRYINSPPDVTLYQVGSQNVNQDIGGGGIVFPRQQLDISYPTSELVKAVLVKAGDRVAPKQSLIQLDASQLTIQIQQAAADMAAAQATLNSVAARGNVFQVAQAQQAYQFAKDRYDAMVAQAQSPILHNGNLISPMSGVVTAVNINPGAVIAANVPLITIMDESTVIVHAKIPLSNLGQVHLGQQATVTPSALPGLTEQGTVTSIVPQADPQTDTFEVWVSVTNTNQMLLPGMSAFVHIQSAGKALVVPRLAVLDPDSKAVVFVVQNLHAHLQHVQVVGRSTNAIFIGQGLKAGDKVVLVGIEGLQDNQPVRVSGVEQNTVSS